MQTLYRKSLPSCDICKKEDLEVVYDMPYIGGHWANLCESCRHLADNPDSPSGNKIVRGQHPNADPVIHHAPLTMGAVLADKQRRVKEEAFIKTLTDEKVAELMLASVVETADGCRVEPDAGCKHGYSSPLVLLGIY